MPDNVPITAGVGTDIATDQLLTGEHVQLLKLVDGTANSSTRIEAGGGAEANAIRVTIANNSTGLVSVDDNGATLSVDDGGGSLTVDGTVSVTDGGGSLTVDGAVTVSDGGGTISVDGTVTANLAAGTNNIGDVDVLTVPAPLNVVGGGTEAAALRVTIANNSTGVVSVDDNGGSLTVDGSVTVADGGGSLTVDGSVTVTDGGGSLTVDGTVTANLAAGTNNIGDVDVLTVPAPLNVTGGGVELGALRVTLANDSTGVLSVDDGGGVLTVDGTVTASDGGGSLTVDNGGTFAVQESGAALTALQLIDNCIAGSEAQVDIVASLPAGNNNIGDVDILTVPAPLNVTGGGTEASALRVTLANDSTGVVSVDDNGSTISVDDGGSSLTIDGTVTAVGAAAHDDAVSGNPVQLAGEARSSERSAVANADVARLVTDLAGKLIALPYANPENFVRGATSDITDTTDTQVIAAGGAGVKLYITQILVTNGDADTGTFVNIKDGSGGTTLYTGYAASGGGGFSVTLPVPIVTTANTGLYAGCATTGATVRVSASGYKGA